MKTAAKVFIILSMIFGFFAILPIVFGAITLGKLNTATSKDELTVWGILELLFGGVIAGILVLCISNEDLASNARPAVAPVAPAAPAAPAANEQAVSDATDNGSNDGFKSL